MKKLKMPKINLFKNPKFIKSKEKISKGFMSIVHFLTYIGGFVLYPLVWLYKSNKKLIDFLREENSDRLLDGEEKNFVLRVPMIQAYSSFTVGLTIAVVMISNALEIVSDIFSKVVDDFNIVDILSAVYGWIESGIVWLFDLIVEGVMTLVDLFMDTFIENAFLALIGLLLLGLLVVFLLITFNSTIIYLVGSPSRILAKLEAKNRLFNEKMFNILIGKDKLDKRNYSYFKKTIFYSSILYLYSLVVGIVIALNPDYLNEISSPLLQVGFISSVLFITGFVSGSFFFGTVGRFVNLFYRKSDKK